MPKNSKYGKAEDEKKIRRQRERARPPSHASFKRTNQSVITFEVQLYFFFSVVVTCLSVDLGFAERFVYKSVAIDACIWIYPFVGVLHICIYIYIYVVLDHLLYLDVSAAIFYSFFYFSFLHLSLCISYTQKHIQKNKKERQKFK